MPAASAGRPAVLDSKHRAARKEQVGRARRPGPRLTAAGGRARRLRRGHTDRSTVLKPRGAPRRCFRQPVPRKAAAVDHHPSAEPRPIACTKSDEDGTIVCGGSAPGTRTARYSCGHPRQAPHHDACRRPRVRPFASVARGNRRTSGRDDGEQRARRVARCLLTAAIGAVDDGRLSPARSPERRRRCVRRSRGWSIERGARGDRIDVHRIRRHSSVRCEVGSPAAARTASPSARRRSASTCSAVPRGSPTMSGRGGQAIA
jgi:hypothetical protein